MSDENKPVQGMAELLKNYGNLPRVISKPKKPNDVFNTYEEIQKFLKFDEKDKYGKGYWLGIIKRSKVTYGEIFGILKEVENADPKYPKDRLLTRKLIPKKK